MRITRSWRAGLLAVGVLLAVVATVGPIVRAGPQAEATVSPSDGPPNIVMILADDLDSRTSPYWEAMPKTAALLRDRGITFSNSFAPNPICCAARASILTGKYGHNTGVLTNAGEVGGFEAFLANDNEDYTIAKYLDDAGYRTGLAGKYLNGIDADPTHIPVGWDEWYGGVDNLLYTGYNYTLNENGTMVRYGHELADYQTDVIADKSVEFISDAAGSGEPFFWYAASTAPHLPIPPAPRHQDHPFVDASAPQSPNFQERNVQDKPTWLRESAWERSAIVATTNDPDYQNRMGSLYALDDMTAEIVETLDDTGELDNTYLVFTSDHGYNLGAHRLVQKMAPYEESLQVPLVIAGPGVTHGTSNDMALSNDLAPTFLDLAGVPIPEDMDGTSLVPLLGGDSADSWRTDFIAQYGGPGEDGSEGAAQEAVPGQPSDEYLVDLPSWSAVRDGQYTYIRWYERERDPAEWEYELYDLTSDPYQLTNLLATKNGREQYADVVARLDQRLWELGACTGASCRT